MKHRVTIHTLYGDLDPVDFRSEATAFAYIDQCAEGMPDIYEGHRIDDVPDEKTSRPNLLLTLFVDSSLCPKTFAGGWGAWAIREGWSKGMLFGGAFGHDTSPRSSREAELCGIANAIAALGKLGHLTEVDRVMVQCDCLQALEMIAGRLDHVTVTDHRDGHKISSRVVMTPRALELAALEVIERAGKTLLVRHVYGHRKGAKRQWVNRQCDTLAKTHMRQARARRHEVLP
jgi:ribonuclease HI